MEQLAPALDSLLTTVRLETPNGRILVPDHPLDVAAVLADLLHDEKDVWALGLEGFRAFAASRDDLDWRILLRFTWVGAEPVAAELHIAELRVGEERYLALPIDGDEHERVIAKLVPATDALLADWLLDAVRSNGAEYGFELFGSLPSRTTNRTGVPVDVLKRAYLEWIERANPATWAQLHGRAAELPDERKRALLDAYFETAYEEDAR